MIQKCKIYLSPNCVEMYVTCNMHVCEIWNSVWKFNNIFADKKLKCINKHFEI